MKTNLFKNGLVTFRVAFIGLCVTLPLGELQAQPFVKYAYESKITEIFDPANLVDPSLVVGTIRHSELQYDLALTDSNADTSIGFYDGAGASDDNYFNGVDADGLYDSSSINITVKNDSASDSADVFQLLSTGDLNPPILADPDISSIDLNVTFMDSTQTVFGNDFLPAELNLDDFDSAFATFHIVNQDDFSFITITYEITSLTKIVDNGDFDSDGDVDGADFLKWQRDFGDTDSLAGWTSNYPDGSLPLIQAVPEPGTLLLSAMAMGSLWLRRRR